MIGRDRACAVQIDADSVSRHHARLNVTPREVSIEDLGSKNGTWVAGERVDGDGVRACGDHTSVVGRRGALEAFQGVAARLPDRIGAFKHHVSDDRPAHVLGEVTQCLVEPMLGERAAGAGIECHEPTVAWGRR